jgi:hypothetical protein
VCLPAKEPRRDLVVGQTARAPLRQRRMTIAFLLAILFAAVTLWWVFGS